MTDRRLYSIEDAAAYLGVSPRSVRGFITAARFPEIRLGRRVLLDKKALDRWIATQGRMAPGSRHREGTR
jgi:excisionase family DNA binding protein